MKKLLFVGAMLACMAQVNAQDVKEIQFCDKKYEYAQGKDSITLFLKVLNSNGKSCDNVTEANLNDYLVIKEDGEICNSSRITSTSFLSAGSIRA